MEESEKKVVIRERAYKNNFNFMSVLGIVLAAILSVLALVCLIISGEMIWLFLLFFFPALGGVLFLCDYITRKKRIEYAFTPVYFVRLRNGKEEERVYWETVGEPIVENGLRDRLYGMKPRLLFTSETIRDGQFDIRNYSLYCSEEELFSIQEIVPVMIAGGKYCSEARKKEIEALQAKTAAYAEDPLFYVSMRGRAAYLICCLENALSAFGRMENWRARLETLWLFTSCIGEEKVKDELESSIESYREEYEAFPEFVTYNRDNFITFKQWRTRATVGFPEAEACRGEAEDYILDRILQAIYRVSAYTPERENYGYGSVHCHVALDEVHAVNDVLRRYRIPLPMPEFYHTQLYLLYSEGTRDPYYGIGLPFNGLVTYSALGADERKKRSSAEVRGAAWTELPSPQDVYERIDEAISPVPDEREKEEPVLGLRLPKSIKALFIGGGITGLCFLVFWILGSFWAKNEMALLCFLFGSTANFFLFFAFSAKRLLYESRYQPYPLKWLDFLLLFGLGIANTVLTFYTFGRLEEIKPFGGFCIATFMIAGAAYFAAWIELCSMRNLHLVAFNTKADYEKSAEKPVKPRAKLTVREIFGVIMAALSMIFYFMYYSQWDFSFVFAVLSVMTGVCGMCLFNRAVTVAQESGSGGKILFLRVVLFLCLASSVVVDYTQGMRTGKIAAVDIAVILAFVFLTAGYILLLIRTFMKKKGKREE